MKPILACLFLLLSSLYAVSGEKKELHSPDGRIRILIETGKTLTWSVYTDGKLVLAPSEIDMQLADGKRLSENLKVKLAKPWNERSVILPPVAEKRSRIPNAYNELDIQFAQPFGVVFRAYDDGVAYRIRTLFPDSITIRRETATFRFDTAHVMWYPQVARRLDADIWHTSFEELYQVKPMDSLASGDMAFTPVLIAPSSGPKVSLTESDLEDYPGMFIQGSGSRSLSGAFAPFPLETAVVGGEFKQAVVTKRADFIARTKGTRSFPWRVLMIAREDRELPANDLVYRLGSPSRVADPSWIHPGKGTDEWIIGVNLFNVPFKAGVNTATYKYYIDFAKRFGFQRIMMDAGWSDPNDLFKINPDINMDSISAYAKEKGIHLSMWTLALTLSQQLEPALDQFNKWGVDFIMTDFMDRDDQEMVRFYTRVAEACARHKLMIMYHGAYKPAGFSRTWPNAITRESVLGSEYNAWSEKPSPEHNLVLPFIRMTAGPMDYEPGILDNATQKTFRPIWEKVMSSGTRCHQAAMFVVYESPVQLFSGNPSQGLLEPEFMELIGSVPTTWDTTIVLDGKVGDYIVTARKKGDEWYIGAMTDWTARDLKLDLGFLGSGDYEATICQDGVNADRYASDYTISKRKVTAKAIMDMHLAPGGGCLMRIQKWVP
jgi:alpha-glucosidase